MSDEGTDPGPRFETLDEVVYGRVEQVAPGIRRVIAENPSKFTAHGTGTYIVGERQVVVIDPGPNLESHREALERALDDVQVVGIAITHCHSDHSPLAAWLTAQSGAPTIGFGAHPRPTSEQLDDMTDDVEGDGDGDGDDAASDISDASDASEQPAEIEEAVDYDFAPGIVIADGELAIEVEGLTMRAVHTPGHTSNHVCYSVEETGALFTGDHIMGWSTTVVSAPDGDMSAYMSSLRKVIERADRSFWPTHGPPRTDTVAYATALYRHRMQREQQIIDLLEAGPMRIREIVAVLYVAVRTELHKAAARSVHAHLIKLVDEGRVVMLDDERPRLRSTFGLLS